MKQVFSRLVLTTAAGLLAACGGSKDGPVVTPPAATIGLTAAAPTLSVAANASGTVALTLARTNFTGEVTLTAEGLPSGVTAVFTPATLAGSATTSTVALAAAGSAAPGTSTVTIRARGTGVAEASASVTLTITPLVGGTLALAVNPTTASIQAGATTSTLVTLTRGGGFSGGVTLTATGATTGVTTTLAAANPVTADTVRLTVATTTAVAAGAITLTLRGNATGLTEATATFTLTVTAPPTTSVTWRFCDPARAPLWFAVQDGLSGTWQRVTETSAGVYNIGFSQPQVGIATVQNEGSRVVTRVAYYGAAEASRAAAQECTDNPAPGTKTVTGTFAGFANSDESARLQLGAATSSPLSNAALPNFTVSNVADGPLDLVAARSNILLLATNRILILRNQNIANNGSLGTIDFNNPSAFAPVTGSVTVTAPNDATVFGRVTFTTNSGAGVFFNTPTPSSGTPVTYQAIPEGVMASGELQDVRAEQTTLTTNIFRQVRQFFRAPPPSISLSMPSDPAAPTVTPITGGPYVRGTFSGAVPTAFNDFVTVQLRQNTRRWEVLATTAGRASAASYSFTLPDFSGIAGWQNTWGLSSGSTDVSAIFYGKSNAGTNGQNIVGTVLVTVGRTSTTTF